MGLGEELKSIRILNRIVTWYPERVEYEADQRHAEAIVRDMNLKLAKSLATAGTDELHHSDSEGEALNSHYSSIYRSVVAKAFFLQLIEVIYNLQSRNVPKA